MKSGVPLTLAKLLLSQSSAGFLHQGYALSPPSPSLLSFLFLSCPPPLLKSASVPLFLSFNSLPVPHCCPQLIAGSCGVALLTIITCTVVFTTFHYARRPRILCSLRFGFPPCSNCGRIVCVLDSALCVSHTYLTLEFQVHCC